MNKIPAGIIYAFMGTLIGLLIIIILNQEAIIYGLARLK